jgi:uncharacterized protein
VERPLPELTGRVVDEAALLSPDAEQRLGHVLAEHERGTSNQVVVVTLDTLDGESIEHFGLRLGNGWGIGQSKENARYLKDGKLLFDNGVLLIIAKQDRRVRIEVGYGLERTLTDDESLHIIEDVIVPEFRRGAFEAGIEAGTKGILQELGGTYVPRQSDRASPQRWRVRLLPLLVLGSAVVACGYFLVRLRRRARDGGS